MPTRYKTNSRGTSHYQPTRKQRKTRYITVKNKIKDPILGHGGVYYTYHVSEGLMTWIDVYFPSLYHKGRYFSAALITCEMKAWDDDETKASMLADAMYPNATLEMKSIRIPRKSPKTERYYSCEFIRSDDYEEKATFEKATLDELLIRPRMIRPSITIDRDYWVPAIGLHGIVNTPSLTEESILEFIKLFRDLGEPANHGEVWVGEEIEVVPARIKDRHAESRSDREETNLD